MGRPKPPKPKPKPHDVLLDALDEIRDVVSFAPVRSPELDRIEEIISRADAHFGSAAFRHFERTGRDLLGGR
jgi:hypothetical protein